MGIFPHYFKKNIDKTIKVRYNKFNKPKEGN